MAKKVQALIKLQVAAGAANPSPPVGPALGQHGVNIMEFCKAFNAKTEALRKRRSSTSRNYCIRVTALLPFVTKTPPASFLLEESGWNQRVVLVVLTLKKWVTVTTAQLEEIVKTKEPDLTAGSLEAAVRTIAGSARSMGLVVED